MKAASTLSLNQVKVEFDAWRASRTGRARIPEHLWASALELLNYYPISTVKTQLNLNLKQLKQRSANGQLDQHSLSKQQFLEIKPTELAVITGPPHAANHKRQMDSLRLVAEPVCRIAFERSDGSRLTISLPCAFGNIA